LLYFNVTAQKRELTALPDFIAQSFDLGHAAAISGAQRTSHSERPFKLRNAAARSPVRQLAGSRRRRFRHQPTFHVCGSPKLSSFSDGFGSLQSERQSFGLRQSLGCPSSPVVAIEII
jgi:hypothetical protein